MKENDKRLPLSILLILTVIVSLDLVKFGGVKCPRNISAYNRKIIQIILI